LSRKRDTVDGDMALTGTTLKVYRFMYRQGKALGIHEIQNALKLSSSSVAQYHVKKLETAGMVNKDENSRYYVNRLVFENMIRIRRSLIPLQAAFALSFGTALVLLIVLFRPDPITSGYLFATAMVGFACAIFAYQSVSAARKATI
jgi:hypothetical protein